VAGVFKGVNGKATVGKFRKDEDALYAMLPEGEFVGWGGSAVVAADGAVPSSQPNVRAAVETINRRDEEEGEFVGYTDESDEEDEDEDDEREEGAVPGAYGAKSAAAGHGGPQTLRAQLKRPPRAPMEDPNRLSLSLRPLMRSSVDRFRFGKKDKAGTNETSADRIDKVGGAGGTVNPLTKGAGLIASTSNAEGRKTRANTKLNRGAYSVELHLRRMKYLEAIGKMPAAGSKKLLNGEMETEPVSESEGSMSSTSIRFNDEVKVVIVHTEY